MINKKEVDEVLDEASMIEQEEEQKLPEAPASANVRVKTKNGYQWQITMRTEKVSQLVRQMEMAEDLFISKGWSVPNWQSNGETPPDKSMIEEKKCPECGKTARRLQVKKEGKNKGRWFWGCEDKSCKFFEWA